MAHSFLPLPLPPFLIMATYLIGDIHGHASALSALFKKIPIDRDEDRFFFAGDLINGGTQNLAVISFIRELGPRAEVVLGNHDLTALAVYYGTRSISSSSTITDVLSSTEASDIFEWLRRRPMALQPTPETLLIHAGVPIGLTLAEILQAAQAVERKLLADDPSAFFTAMFQDAPLRWDACSTQLQREVFTVNALTRQRTLFADGSLEFDFKSTLQDLPPHLTPWFLALSATEPLPHLFFGHWSALGFSRFPNATCLDSGVRWGGPLTAVRLEDGKVFLAVP